MKTTTLIINASVFLIIVVLMILNSCSATPTTPRLPVAVKPNYPLLSENELALLRECRLQSSICTIYRETLNKLSRKDQLCRNYARELRSTILMNNQR